MILKKCNVERIAGTEARAAKLKKEGFEEITGTSEAVAKKPPQDTADMTVVQLRELAREKGLSGYSSLSKEELLAVLKDVV